jgi:recombinational DNA repair protein RecT
VSQAVATVQLPVKILKDQLTEFATLLPKSIDPERFESWALVALKNGLRKQETAEAWARVLHPGNEAGLISVILALKDCASLGLEPGRTFHLVPFGSQVAGVTDWKGEVQLITNARPCSVVAQLVRKGDTFAMRAANAPPHHTPPDPDDAASWFDSDREVIGGYSYVDNGHQEYSMVVRMSEAELLARREMARTKSIWDKWPAEMRFKTLIKPLRKTVPWSPERLWT